MLTTDCQRTESNKQAGLLTWELGAYGDRVSYTPPSGDAPQVCTDLSFAHFSPTVSVSAQAIHELLHPFARQLARRYGEVLSEFTQRSPWSNIELNLFDARVEVLVMGLQQRLFPVPSSVPRVQYGHNDEGSAPNVWLQGVAELLGTALLQGSDGEDRAEAIRTALLPALTALSGRCELSESGRDRRLTVHEHPVFSPLETSEVIALLNKGIASGLPCFPLIRIEDLSKGESLTGLFSSVYGGGAAGIRRLLRDFTDCYPGPEFRGRFRAME